MHAIPCINLCKLEKAFRMYLGQLVHMQVCFKGCLFCFVALRPKSTAMVIAGRSVHLTTLFPGQA